MTDPASPPSPAPEIMPPATPQPELDPGATPLEMPDLQPDFGGDDL
jgi:hypothetical protein